MTNILAHPKMEKSNNTEGVHTKTNEGQYLNEIKKGLKMKIPFSIGLYNFENDSSILGCALV